MPPIPKLRKLDELAQSLVNRKVVLANGCFDILHAGHVRYLQAARMLGDTLVVAINSDRSARSLKGPERPIMNEEERVTLVSALKCVDYVVLFDETDVSVIIRRLKPSVHAKGTDYTEETVPERQQVLAYGGAIRIAGDPKDHSSRDVIRKITGVYGRP